MALSPWIALVVFGIHVLLLHVAVLGVLQWTANSTGGRIGAAVVGIALAMGIYVQEYFYAKWLVLGKVRGWHSILLFLCGFVSMQLVHGSVFVIMASFGETFSVPLNVAQSFDVFYRYCFPLAAGVFMTAGNASITPVGIPSHLWWVWTSWVGGIHLLFVFGFGMARLTQYWGGKKLKGGNQINLAMEFGPISNAIGMKQRESFNKTRRRHRTPPKHGHMIPIFPMGQSK